MSNQIKKLYILRHGETNMNINDSKDRLLKQPENTSINENGKEQAKKTGIYLKNRDKINLIICSPTLRCKQTAEIICEQIGYDKSNIIFEKNLVETQINPKYKNITRKEFENLKDSDHNVSSYFKFLEKKNQIKTPIELNEFLIKYDSNNKVNVYENSESLSSRLNEVIEKIKFLPTNNILIISHGGTIRWLNKLITNNIGYDEFKGKIVKNNSNCALTYYINNGGEFFLVSANSNHHLLN